MKKLLMFSLVLVAMSMFVNSCKKEEEDPIVTAQKTMKFFAGTLTQNDNDLSFLKSARSAHTDYGQFIATRSQLRIQEAGIMLSVVNSILVVLLSKTGITPVSGRRV